MFVLGIRDVKVVVKIIIYLFINRREDIVKHRGPCSFPYTVNFCKLRRGFVKALMIANNSGVHPSGLRMLWLMS